MNYRYKTPAPNGRFCEIAAVAPLERQCKLENYYPARTFVEAATSQSRWDVRCYAGQFQQIKS